MARRRTLLMLVPALGLAVACAGLGLPRELVFSQAQLQAALDEHLARRTRVAEVIDLTLAQPRVRLLPERDRLASALDVTARERITGHVLRGSVQLEHTLRFEPADASLRLAEPRVTALELDLGAGPLVGTAARLSEVIVERALDDAVLWRASASQRDALVRAGVQRGDIRVTARGVELRFMP
jgi:hypothetical protein